MRRTDGCMNCGETREIAGHGLCFACYRRAERAKESETLTIDRHNPGIRREHTKIFRGFNRVMAGLADLGVPRAPVLEIRRLIGPYLDPISEYLALPDTETTKRVNGEQTNAKPFTVHASASQTGIATDKRQEQDPCSDGRLQSGVQKK